MMGVVRYRDMGDSLLVRLFGRSPKARILDIFLANPFFDFSGEGLARELGMSKQTLYRNIRELEELGVIVVSRKVGRAVMYRLNRENPVVKALNNLVNQLSLQIAEREELSTVSLREA